MSLALHRLLYSQGPELRFCLEKHHICSCHGYCSTMWLHVALNKVQVGHVLLGLSRACHKLLGHTVSSQRSADSKKTSQVAWFGPALKGMPTCQPPSPHAWIVATAFLVSLHPHLSWSLPPAASRVVQVQIMPLLCLHQC